MLMRQYRSRRMLVLYSRVAGTVAICFALAYFAVEMLQGGLRRFLCCCSFGVIGVYTKKALQITCEKCLRLCIAIRARHLLFAVMFLSPLAHSHDTLPLVYGHSGAQTQRKIAYVTSTGSIPRAISDAMP